MKMFRRWTGGRNQDEQDNGPQGGLDDADDDGEGGGGYAVPQKRLAVAPLIAPGSAVSTVNGRPAGMLPGRGQQQQQQSVGGLRGAAASRQTYGGSVKVSMRDLVDVPRMLPGDAPVLGKEGDHVKESVVKTSLATLMRWTPSSLVPTTRKEREAVKQSNDFSIMEDCLKSFDTVRANLDDSVKKAEDDAGTRLRELWQSVPPGQQPNYIEDEMFMEALMHLDEMEERRTEHIKSRMRLGQMVRTVNANMDQQQLTGKILDMSEAMLNVQEKVTQRASARSEEAEEERWETLKERQRKLEDARRKSAAVTQNLMQGMRPQPKKASRRERPSGPQYSQEQADRMNSMIAKYVGRLAPDVAAVSAAYQQQQQQQVQPAQVQVEERRPDTVSSVRRSAMRVPEEHFPAPPKSVTIKPYEKSVFVDPLDYDNYSPMSTEGESADEDEEEVDRGSSSGSWEPQPQPVPVRLPPLAPHA